MCPGVSIKLIRYRVAAPVPRVSSKIIDAVCAFTVMPRSLSTFNVSSTWPRRRSLSLMLPVSVNNASLNVDFPWSTCAMTEKLRMCVMGTSASSCELTTSKMVVRACGVGGGDGAPVQK